LNLQEISPPPKEEQSLDVKNLVEIKTKRAREREREKSRPTLSVIPFGFSVNSVMRQFRSSDGLTATPGFAGPTVSGVVVVGLGVLSI